jgi:iron complex outermembrane receptor protein
LYFSYNKLNTKIRANSIIYSLNFLSWKTNHYIGIIHDKTMNKIIYVLLLGVVSITMQAQKTIQGTIRSEEGPLIGANVVISGTTNGTITDLDGKFQIETTQDYPINVDVSYVGYQDMTLPINNERPVIVNMQAGNLIVDELIISASRKAEKLQEAPAAVSVLSAEQISQSGGSISPIRALINTPGVELQQQTGQRINIALRGSSGVFSTNVFPMLDYRSLITPGLEYFDSQNSPINNIDVERVEVVLGPGSALYGPDVTTGVVHWISKDPFRYPGTTAELIYGERNTFKAAIRHAGHDENEKIGYKINARYGSGRDFALDPEDPTDASILSTFQETIRRGFVTEEGFVDPQQNGRPLFSPGQFQNEDYWAAAINGHLHLRPTDDTQIVGSGGWNAGSAIFYNDLGEGFNFSNEYYGQVRLNHKGFFAQTYYIRNDGGNDDNPVFLNRTGLIVPLERSHFEAQVQYNFDLPGFLNSEWSAGFDYRNAKANTENHVYGRNEDNDDYRIAGGYVQAKLKPFEKLDIFLAGRYDSYNFTDEKTFSPRAAFVYKPNQFNTFRLSYNKAPNPIPASDIFFDLPIQTTPIFNVWNLGGIETQTFATDPVIDWLIPGVPNTTFSTGFPLAAAYAAVNEDVIAGVEALGSQDPTLAPLVPALVELLRSQAPQGFSNSFVSTDASGNELLPENVPTTLISSLTALEFGYKGLFWEKFAAGFDVYYFRRTRGGGFGQVSPFITLTNLPSDLGVGVQELYQPQIQGLLQQFGFDEATAAGFAGQIGGILNGAYTQGGEAFIEALTGLGFPAHGIAPTDQVPQTGFPQLAFGYPTRNPDDINDDWGWEFHSKYYFSEHLQSFFNYTWFNNPGGEPGDLNFPQNKIRIGIQYQPAQGWFGDLSYQWNQAYQSNNATFPGPIDARSLFDGGIGYKFEKGLSLSISGSNLLNNEFRTLPGFPKIGRLVTTRALYDF